MSLLHLEELTKLSNDETNLLDKIGAERILDAAMFVLKSGSFGLDKYDIKDIKINEDSLLIYYTPKVENRVAIYSDICQIMSFFVSFIGDDLKKKGVQAIGVEASIPGKLSRDNIYVVSQIDVAKELGKGNIVYWYNNSFRNEPLFNQDEVYLLIEGETEYVAYPILFKSSGYSLVAHRIKLLKYSELDLRSTLKVFAATQHYFYLVCDNDKIEEITDLNREGYFKSNNYHVLSKGEFEDYVESDALVGILETIDPGIGITSEYIESNRYKKKSTSKIISDYYYHIGNKNGYVLPGKPKLGEEIAHFWSQSQIPPEIKSIIYEVMNIAN